MIRCPVSAVPRSPLSSAAAMIAGAVFDEVVPPEGLVASLGQENLENISDCSRLLRRCFLQRLAKHALWIEVI